MSTEGQAIIGQSAMLLLTVPTFALILVVLSSTWRCSAAQVSAGETLNAYIKATHKRVFDEFNVAIFGDLSVTKAAFRGAIGVQERATLADFDVGGDFACDPDRRSMVVGRTLSARMGAIHGGYIVAGRGSSIHHTVKLSCSNRVERYDVVRNGDVDFDSVRRLLLKESAEYCVNTAPAENVRVENETMIFQAGERGVSCYTSFRVSTADLRLIKTWRLESDDHYRNIIVVLSGSKAEFRDFQMIGFNPRRTLIVLCSIYSSFSLFNAKIQGSIMGPTSMFTTMETIINGSVIMGGLRGSIATLNVPYITC